MSRLGKRAVKRALLALLAVILVGGVAHAVSIDAFNKTEHTTIGADTSQPTYLQFSDRQDSTSKWLKRDFDLDGRKVDLQAQTIDGTLVNNSDDMVSSWQAVINIEGDCFINNAWVGTVEIHQFVGTDSEKVQTLDLRDYNLDDVELEYRYDGDLLIPLKAGDFIVYHPNAADELEVAPRSELVMGTIFYYLDDLDLSNYTISYRYHRDFTHGISFIVLAVLAILWVLLAAGTGVADVAYRRALREAELRKTGLASMSSIYSIISFINLKSDELIPVYANEETKDAIPEGLGAKEQLREIFARDTAAPYRTAVLEFIDIDTLPARLEKGSIALEYVSKAYGWSKVRFFPVDEANGQPLERVLLTIEDINNEKEELEHVEQHAAEVELEISTRGTFVMGMSTGMRPQVEAIDELAAKIMAETDDESVGSYAKQIRSRGRLLTYLIDGAIESSTFDGRGFKEASEEYAPAELVADACSIAATIAQGAPAPFEPDVSPTIPQRLVGDARRIERALIGILAYVTRLERVDSVKVSAFGKQHGDAEHVLFSVKASGSGANTQEAREFAEFIADAREHSAHVIDEDIKELEGVALMLMLMGSQLHVVNDPGQGVEFYFEMEQALAEGGLG